MPHTGRGGDQRPATLYPCIRAVVRIPPPTVRAVLSASSSLPLAGGEPQTRWQQFFAKTE